MRKRLVWLAFVALGLNSAFAQQGASVKHLKFPIRASVNMADLREDYHPLLIRTEAPFPGGNSEKAWLAGQKALLESSYTMPGPVADKVDSTAPSPWMGDNFGSNFVIDGVPNDNDMGISNDGKIVSVVNGNLYMHDEYGTTLVGNRSLDTWSAALGMSGTKFDPRALYDPVHDRWIVACLNGFDHTVSAIVVGFSQTNDPTGAWNLYALPGDPNNDTLFTDYPILALTHDELFITVNLLHDNQPWQTGFVESVCWQIGLDSAYAGDSLDTGLWYNIGFGGAPIRNLCPIQGGSAPSGPNMYLLSNRNFAAGNDTVFILEITDTLHAPGAQLLVDARRSNATYSLPPDAHQPFNQLLATNDARWLDGFIENGVVQFVGNSRDSATGRAAFYHGRIDDIAGARTVTGNVIVNPNGDYGYPAIAWMGMSPTDNDALIAINYSGTTAATRPGCGSIYYDGVNDYSPLVVAKSGANYINALTGIDRWGDYTGIQRRYNENGVVWMAGTYGKADRMPGTWIAEFHHPNIVGTMPADVPPFEAVAYPNPSPDRMFVEFQLEEATFLEIAIWDAGGRKVKTLVRDQVKAGKNKFGFSTEPLANGTYFLRITAGDQQLAEQKIVKIR